MTIVLSAKKMVMERSRETKLRHFYSLFQEGQTVLDVGVSSENRPGLPARNLFLKTYRHSPETYTGLGIQDLSGMQERYPGKSFVQYGGGLFPFPNKQFDWVFSNAVIEHVGNDDDQLLFVNEMLRVARSVFFTTPNKYFPIESHTNAVLLHWHDDIFWNWLKKRRPGSSRYSIYLLSSRRLRKLMKQSSASSFQITKNRMLGLTMTFTVVCTGVESAH
jgi:SAM-dependent methyltransferase